MKVALCLSGHMRTYESTYDSLKRYVIDKYSPDIFISTWDTLGFWSADESGFNPANNLPVKSVKDRFNPISLNIESYPELEASFIEKAVPLEREKIWYNRPKNVVSMYYKSNDSVRLKREHEIKNNFKYDLVIKTRPDILYKEELPDFELGRMYVLDNDISTENGLGDIFFAGSSSDIDSFFELYNDLEKLLHTIPPTRQPTTDMPGILKLCGGCKETYRYCPHEYVKHYLVYKHIQYSVFNVETELLNTPQGYCKE